MGLRLLLTFEHVKSIRKALEFDGVDRKIIPELHLHYFKIGLFFIEFQFKKVGSIC